MAPSLKTPERIAIAQIRMDGGTQSRARIDDATVVEYAEAMGEGAAFPPVTLVYDGNDYWLADGFHRVNSALKVGFIEIDAYVQQGGRRDAVLLSCGANSDHGMRRSNADKRRAVETLLNDEEWGKWSDREIARRCGVSDRFVNSMRTNLSANGSQIERTAQRGGTVYTMKTPSRPGRTLEQLERQEATGQEGRTVIEQHVETVIDSPAEPVVSTPAETPKQPRKEKYLTLSDVGSGFRVACEQMEAAIGGERKRNWATTPQWFAAQKLRQFLNLIELEQD